MPIVIMFVEDNVVVVEAVYSDDNEELAQNKFLEELVNHGFKGSDTVSRDTKGNVIAEKDNIKLFYIKEDFWCAH